AGSIRPPRRLAAQDAGPLVALYRRYAFVDRVARRDQGVRDQDQVGRLRNALHVRGGTLRPGALVPLAGQQSPIAEHQHALGVDERQGAGFLRKSIRVERVRLEILVVELEGDGGPHWLEQLARRPVDQVTLATVDKRDHAAAVGANTR